MLYQDYIKVLYIDLFKKKIRFENRADLCEFIGGSGVAAKLFSEGVRPDLPPMAPEQPIVLAIGPMSTIFPVCTKTVAAFFSPQTGEYGESHAGGRLAMAIRMANVDAIVLNGASSEPVYVTIKPDDITFHDAEAIWEMPVGESGQFMRSMAGAPGHRSIIRIGPAGANLVPIAGVNVDTYRHFGRLGLGAAFGSKKLKGLVISGEQDFAIKNPAEYNKIYQEIFDKVTKTPAMAKYHELGTPKNVLPLNKINGLPSYNLKKSNYEFAENVSGEAFAKDVLERKLSCSGCPVGCIHIGNLRKLFDTGFEYESVGVSYDHELVFSLGTELGMKNPTDILNLIDAVEEEGMDAISAGVILGFMTEALEKNDIAKEDALAELKFGETEGYLKAIHYLANPPNEFYKKIGCGLSKYTKDRKDATGDYALLLGGLEISGYFTGPAHLLGGVTGVRHSHVDNAGYSIDQKLKEFTAKNIVEAVLKEECERSVLTSLVICLFAREVYDLDTVSRALAVIGITKTVDDLRLAARKILKLKLELRERLGFKIEDHRLAARYFETPSPRGVMTREFMDSIVAEYREAVKAYRS